MDDIRVLMKLVDKFTPVAKRIANATQHMSNKLKGLKDNFKNVSSHMKTFNNKLEKVGKIARSAAVVGILAITAALIGFNVVAVKAAMAYEHAWIGVTKTVDGTNVQMEVLRHQLDKVAISATSSIESTFGVAEAAGQLGIARENIAGFTKTMLDLGLTTDMAAETAAMSLAQFANVVNMNQADFDRLGSTIVDLGNNLATTESRIVDMAMRLGGAGSAAGMNAAQIMGLSGHLSSLGIQAEMGGSAMARLLIQMSSNIDSTNIVMKSFAATAGMSVDKFRKLFKSDAAGALDAFVGGLSKLKAAGRMDLFEQVLKGIKLTSIRAKDMLLRLAGGNKKIADSIKMAMKAWEENKALMEEAKKRHEELAAKVQVLKTHFSILGASLGKQLYPVLTKIIDKCIIPLIEWLEGLSDNTKKWIMFTILITTAILGLTIAIGALVAVFYLLSWPILLVAVAIVAVIATIAFLVAYWDEVCNWMSEKWALLTDKLSAAWFVIKIAFMNFFDEAKEKFALLVDVTKQTVENFIKFWTSGLDKIKNMIMSWANIIKEKIAGVLPDWLAKKMGVDITSKSEDMHTTRVENQAQSVNVNGRLQVGVEKGATARTLDTPDTSGGAGFAYDLRHAH